MTVTKRHWPILALALVVLLGTAACADKFQSAARAADTEKAIVEDAFKQVYNLTRTTPPKVSAANYETIKASYNVWAGAMRVQADALANWKRQIDEEKATGRPAAADWKGKYEAASTAATATYASFIALVQDIVRLRTGSVLPTPPGDAIRDVDYLERDAASGTTSALPLALAALPLGLALGTRRRRPGDPLPPIMGGAGITGQVEAGLKLALALISSLQSKAAEYAALGLNYLPFVVAIGHVAETAYDKVQEMLGGGGVDFLAMTPEQIHAHFLPKTVEELEAEARAGR